MKVNYDLVNRLISTNITPAVEYFRITNDCTPLKNQINFAVQQIIVCLNSDTVPTIKELLNAMKVQNGLAADHHGWLEAINALDDKYKV